MRLAFVVDPLDGLDPGVDSTVGLVEAAQRRGHDVWVCEARELALFDGRVRARLRRVHVATAVREAGRFVVPGTWYWTDEAPGWMPLDAMDGIFLRTDPLHIHTNYLVDFVADRTTVVNDPRGIRLAHRHLFPLQFPELVPPTVVTADASVISSFVRDCGRAVVEPVYGPAGGAVVHLRPDDPNLDSLVDSATAGGRVPVIVHASPDAPRHGVTRLVVIDGEPVGAVVRFPGDVGAPIEMGTVSAADRAVVARLAPVLRRHGLWLVGLDVVDGRLSEIDAANTGALREADAALGTHLAEEVIARFEWFRRTNRPLATAVLADP
jgi:glutathione synthase